MRSTLKWSKIIPYFFPHKWFIKGERGGGKGQTKDREGQTHSQHIFSSLRRRGVSRSFNYWLPSQANIPACQGPFWLSFGQSPSDGPHFLLNRTRRCCENGDTWSCVQETGSASAKAQSLPRTLLAYFSTDPMRVESQLDGVQALGFKSHSFWHRLEFAPLHAQEML